MKFVGKKGGVHINNKKIRLIIIEDNMDLNCALAEFLKSKIIFEVVGTACDGLKGLELLRKKETDVVLLDIVMPGKDGLSILAEFSEVPREKKPAFIMFTAISAEVFTQRALELGADYFVLKPFDLEILAKRIIQVHTAKENETNYDKDGYLVKMQKDNEYEAYITELLHRAGIATNLKGHRYLKTAIAIAAKDDSLMHNITKKLYPSVADIFEVNPAQVERSMRHAIGLSWQRDKSKILNVMPPGSWDSEQKPTNSIFLINSLALLKKAMNTY